MIWGNCSIRFRNPPRAQLEIIDSHTLDCSDRLNTFDTFMVLQFFSFLVCFVWLFLLPLFVFDKTRFVCLCVCLIVEGKIDSIASAMTNSSCRFDLTNAFNLFGLVFDYVSFWTNFNCSLNLISERWFFFRFTHCQP